MADERIIDAVKLALRITTDALDDEISSEIESCLADLTICGVIANPHDAAILKAVKLWCRASFEDDVNSRQDYREAYGTLKGMLMVSTGYTHYDDEGNDRACNTF